MLMAAFLTSCENLLNMTPENSVTFENAIENEQDMESAAVTAASFTRVAIGLENYIYPIFQGEYADETYGFFRECRNLANSQITGVSWSSVYTIIAQANIMLRYVDKIPLSESKRKYYRGTACFYKALSYLNIVRRWGDCVLIEDDILMEPVAKSSWVNVVNYAIELAEQAVELLPEFDEYADMRGNPAIYRSTVCKGAANALLANLCAWKAGCKYMAQPADRNYDEGELWAKAEKACSAIIARSSVYSLVGNAEEICTSVLVGESSESIFEITLKDSWHEITSYQKQAPFCMGTVYQAYPSVPGRPEGYVTQLAFMIRPSSVREMYPGSDERKDAFFYKLDEMEALGDGITGGRAYPNKWRKTVVATEGWLAGQFVNFNQNQIVWRLADIYLLRAECRVRQGKDTEAISDLNTVRRRSKAADYHASERNGDLRLAIFKERERELLFEGQRYYDVIRNGYHTTELESGFQHASEQDMIDGCFFLPVHEYAFERNPLMRQNTYWSRKQ